MRKLFQLVGEISIAGVDMLNKQFNAMDKETRKVQRSIEKLGRNIEKTGMALTKTLTVPLVALGAASVKFGADFQKAMASSLAIMGDLSDAMKKDMEMAARSVAKTTRFSATQAAEAYFFLASAGLSAAQSIGALPKVAAFAQAGNFDLALATDLLTDAQSALGMVSKNTAEHLQYMTHVSDVLVKANTLANASVLQFSEALTNKAGAALRILNKDIEEGAAVLAVYADQGVKGAAAGDQLNIVLRDLQRASIENRSAWQAAGVAVYDADGKMRNMADIVEQLEGRLLGMSDEQRRVELTTLGFTDRSISATMALLGTSDAIKEYEKKLRDAGGTTDDVAEKQLKNFWDQLGLVKDRLIDLGLTIYGTLEPIITSKLMPALNEAIKVLEGIVNKFASLPVPMQETIILLVALAAAIGPVMLVIGKTIIATKALTAAILTMNAAMLANPFALAAVAVVAFVLILKGIKDAYDDNIEAHRKWTAITTEQAAIDSFTAGVDTLTQKIMGYGDQLNDAKKAQELLGKDFEDLTTQARALGYTIEGDMIEKMSRLQEISHSLKGSVYDMNGELIRTTKEGKKVADIIEEITSKMAVSIEQQIKLKQAQLENTNDFEQQYVTRRKILELQMQEEIKKAKETGESIHTIREIYAEQFTALENERLDKIDEINNKEKELREKLSEENLNNAKAEIDTRVGIDNYYGQKLYEMNHTKLQMLRDERDAAIAEAERTGADVLQIKQYYAQLEREIIAENIAVGVGYAQQFLTSIGQIADNHYQKQAMLIDANLEKEIDAINKSTMAKEEKEAAISALDKKAAAEKKKLQQEQAKRDKALGIFNAVIGTAAAIVSAIQLPWPLNLVMAILYGALGAVQIATIASQPIPMRRGAYVKGQRGGVQAEIGEGDEDELVLPMKTGVMALADALVQRLAEIKMPQFLPPAMPQMAMAGGGTMSTGGGSGGNINLHIGTLVADDSGLKELERRLHNFRIMDEQRKGRAEYGYR